LVNLASLANKATPLNKAHQTIRIKQSFASNKKPVSNSAQSDSSHKNMQKITEK
jgi:hypothetical protein